MFWFIITSYLTLGEVLDKTQLVWSPFGAHSLMLISGCQAGRRKPCEVAEHPSGLWLLEDLFLLAPSSLSFWLGGML